ncbi:MAG TPA: hypothetical protein V6D14_26465 [Coleofasciculaceae cyanobacterium]
MRRLLIAVGTLTLLAGCTSQASISSSDFTPTATAQRSSVYANTSKIPATSASPARELRGSDTASVHERDHSNKASVRRYTRRSKRR